MSSYPLNSDVATQPSRWEGTPSHAPTPGDFGRERTPSVFCSSPAYTYGDPSSPSHRPASDHLGFLEDTELDPQGIHNGGATESIKSLIEWKVTLNNRFLARDTEQDLVFKPSHYWQQIKEKAERIVQRKKSRNQRVRSDNTIVTVAVNERSQRDLTKHFEGTDINWTPIEMQLLTWENLYRQGKRLRLSVSINYIEDSALSSSRTDKRGNKSATNGMLRDLHDQVIAEDLSGQPPIWRDVYKKMRCPGPPCHHEGQYCWLDPVGKKHHKMRTHHMKALVKYVEQGGRLDSHDDVPDTIRDQLYAEEQQRIDKRQKPANAPTGSMYPPININNINVAPTQSTQPPNNAHEMITSGQADLDIAGPIEEVVEEYTNWHLEKVNTENFKANIRKARDIVLENCLDLGQLRDTTVGAEFFVKEGVKIGVAYRFVSDTGKWLEQRKRKRVTEDDDL